MFVFMFPFLSLTFESIWGPCAVSLPDPFHTSKITYILCSYEYTNFTKQHPVCRHGILGTEKVPQENCVTKILPNVRVNFLVQFASKPVFYWVMTGNPLELFRNFFGAVRAIFWLCGSFLSPEYCSCPDCSDEEGDMSHVTCLLLWLRRIHQLVGISGELPWHFRLAQQVQHFLGRRLPCAWAPSFPWEHKEE